MDLLALCESVKGNAEPIAEDVINRWHRIGAAEPWLALPDDLDLDHLPGLIRLLAAASLCTDYDRGLCQEAIRAAASHGERRAKQGYGETLLHREYHLLRRGLAEHLKGEHGDGQTVYLAVMRMDALTTPVISAALHGFHRVDLEAEGRWPEVIDEILDEWPLPGA